MFKLEDGFEVDENDVLVLVSGQNVRAWAYETHCKFNSYEEVRIKEVLRNVWRSSHE